MIDEFEIFCDEACYDMRCVRLKLDKRFCSPMSFHFVRKQDAEEMIDEIRHAKLLDAFKCCKLPKPFKILKQIDG